MKNYWIGIMALAFVIAMATWLLLVFNADRRGSGKPQESSPQREVIGGEFEAREGGRQLMPHPAQPSEQPATPPDATLVPGQAAAEPEMPMAGVPGQRTPAVTPQDAPKVPAQGTATAPEHAEHAPGRGDRP